MEIQGQEFLKTLFAYFSYPATFVAFNYGKGSKLAKISGIEVRKLTNDFGKRRRDDLVAQLVEHYTFNVRVLGSNPSGITRARDSSFFMPDYQ